MNDKENTITSILNSTASSIEEDKKKAKEYVIKYMVVHLYFVSGKKIKEIAKLYNLKVKEVSKIVREYEQIIFNNE